MSDPNVFIVDDESAPPETAVPVLGHIERRCAECGAEWVLPQPSCGKCHGQIFTETVVAPSLLQRIGARIMGVATPETPKARRAPAELVSELRGFQVTTERYRAELVRIDGLLSAAVRDGVDELLPAHGILHQATFISGDRSARNVKGLSLGLESIDACLGAEITNLEDTPK